MERKRSVVILFSGGLDSTVVSTIACEDERFEEIILIYFRYSCKSEEKEIQSVKNISEFLIEKYPEKNIKVEFFCLDFLKNLGGSTLTDPNKYGEIGDEKIGSETPNEWVPARNLLMLSMVAAYCDRNGIETIYIGTNKEESLAYPDNTEKFIEHINQTLLLGTLVKCQVFSPLIDFMKDEIINIGIGIGSPIHLSWSCYHNFEKHCGSCGSCFLRKRAFKKLNILDSIDYLKN